MSYGQARSKANTKEYNENYGKVDWKNDQPTRPGRAVRGPKPGGGYDCGIKTHDHSTFAQAAACVTGKGK